MPELPEVELTMRVLKPLIAGKRLVSFYTNRERGLKSSIPSEKISREVEGLKIKNVSRRGKTLFISLDSPAKLSFAVHLRMSGSLLFGRPKIISRLVKRKHVHFIWRFQNGDELWFRDPRKFGVVWYGTAEELVKDKYLGSLGPDALFISLAEFSDRIRRHPAPKGRGSPRKAGRRGQLKPLLLRQDVLAGLGNITVDESLWEAKINPRRNAESLSVSAVAVLHHCVQGVLRRIIKAEGNTVRDWVMPDGRAGKAPFGLKVYGKEGKPCFRCGQEVRRTIVGGRGTHYCPKCQTPK